MQRIVYVELLDKKLIVCDRICCESLFQKAILPLDKFIQALVREDIICKDGINYSGKLGSFVFIIINAMLNKHYFDEEDIKFIKNNIELFNDKKVIKALSSVFFTYTDKLIKDLKAYKFDDIFIRYIKNTGY